MSELKISITVLISYIMAILGIANIERFQEGIINFSPEFFILIAVVVFSELIITSSLLRAGVKLSYYAIIAFWLLVYVLLWIFYFKNSRPVEVEIIQILLVLLASVLAFDVNRRIGQLDTTLDGLSSNAYPNRAREIQEARDIISAEITRSRRYHHPLSVLTIRLGKPENRDIRKSLEPIATDILERFAVAKTSQILSDLARSTDLVLLDKGDQFVILCPETNPNNVSILAGRIAAAVEGSLKTSIEWGTASFPDEALTFDDLLQTAQSRLSPIITKQKEPVEVI